MEVTLDVIVIVLDKISLLSDKGSTAWRVCYIFQLLFYFGGASGLVLIEQSEETFHVPLIL